MLLIQMGLAQCVADAVDQTVVLFLFKLKPQITHICDFFPASTAIMLIAIAAQIDSSRGFLQSWLLPAVAGTCKGWSRETDWEKGCLLRLCNPENLNSWNPGPSKPRKFTLEPSIPWNSETWKPEIWVHFLCPDTIYSLSCWHFAIWCCQKKLNLYIDIRNLVTGRFVRKSKSLLSTDLSRFPTMWAMKAIVQQLLPLECHQLDSEIIWLVARDHNTWNELV